MLTVEEWERSKIDFGNEIFEPIFEEWLDNLHGPFMKCVGYQGTESGRLLHPDFSNILEP